MSKRNKRSTPIDPRGDGSFRGPDERSVASYVSDNVFDGTRELTPEHTQRLRQIAEEAEQAVFCINCTHHQDFGPLHKCDAAISLVTGQQLNVDCAAMRLTTGQCGPSGKLFTQRP